MTLSKRQRSVEAMDFLNNHRSQVDYLQLRPMRTKGINTMAKLRAALANGKHMAFDCSEAVTLVMHIGGFRDPSGNAYNGYGDTQTMLNHLPRFHDPKLANICSIVVFNANYELARQHVAICHTPDRTGGDPVVFTHGGEADPHLRKLSFMQPGFSGKTVWLSVANL